MVRRRFGGTLLKTTETPKGRSHLDVRSVASFCPQRRLGIGGERKYKDVRRTHDPEPVRVA